MANAIRQRFYVQTNAATLLIVHELVADVLNLCVAYSYMIRYCSIASALFDPAPMLL